jgi:hypothetical protein
MTVNFVADLRTYPESSVFQVEIEARESFSKPQFNGADHQQIATSDKLWMAELGGFLPC